jgi:hypothetical protein
MDSVEISHRKFARIVTVFFITSHCVFPPRRAQVSLKKFNFQKLDIDPLPRQFLFPLCN